MWGDKRLKGSGEMSGERTDFRLVLLFSDESLGVASSEGGVEGEGSFFAREGGMKKR